MLKLPNILLVEDDPNITAALVQAFSQDYHVDTALTGKAAIYKTDLESYQLILLDLGLPDVSGYDICQQLRERGVTTPILILSGESRVLTKINLLDAGADDFLSKPFSLGELKARMRVLIRTRQVTDPPPKQLIIGTIALDRQSRTVTRDEVPITLRRKEFALLECLMEHSGSVVTREILTRRAWDDSESVWTNTIDVHIKHLRDKLDKPFSSPVIKTVHGLGYKFEITHALVQAEM